MSSRGKPIPLERSAQVSIDTAKHWERRMLLYVVSYVVKFGIYYSPVVWS